MQACRQQHALMCVRPSVLHDTRHDEQNRQSRFQHTRRASTSLLLSPAVRLPCRPLQAAWMATDALLCSSFSRTAEAFRRPMKPLAHF